MKRTTLIGLASLVVGLMLIGNTVYAQGYMNNRAGGCCNGMWRGGNIMGMNRSMMGPGMMSRGMMMPMDDCPMMMGPMWGAGMNQGPWNDLRYDAYGRLIEPINKKQAEEIAQYYVNWTGNPNLKVGKINEKSNVFEVSIVTKDNSLVNKLAVDKETGSVQPEIQ